MVRPDGELTDMGIGEYSRENGSRGTTRVPSYLTIFVLIVGPTCGERDIVVTTSVRCMCDVRCASVRICSGHNLYIYACSIIWHRCCP